MTIHPLTQYRKDHGLTCEALAKMLDTTKGVVSKWEAGKAMPRAGALKKIAEVTENKVTAADMAGAMVQLQNAEAAE